MTSLNRRSFLQALGALLAAGPAALWAWARPARAWRWSDYGQWFRDGEATLSIAELRGIEHHLKRTIRLPKTWGMALRADAERGSLLPDGPPRRRIEVSEWGYGIQLEAPLNDLLLEDPR